jgi:hypothetical protein
MTLCRSASAATMHHFRTRHHHVTSSLADSLAYEPARPPVHYHTHSDNDVRNNHDASTFGGSTALPAE